VVIDEVIDDMIDSEIYTINNENSCSYRCL